MLWYTQLRDVRIVWEWTMRFLSVYLRCCYLGGRAANPPTCMHEISAERLEFTTVLRA